jgi:G3E family GTPase
MTNSKIPVTIITGFLGAGKTTLLNSIIARYPDLKFAIIENEFGDIPIDQELVVGLDEGIFELSNGCICCTLNSELGEVLQKLASDNYQFDHLLIETTGIAEPDAVAAAFIGPGKGKTFELDGTICVADAQYIEQNLSERGEAVKQVSFADLIMLSKTDTIGETEIKKAETAIRAINENAPLIRKQNQLPDNPNLLNLQAYNWKKVEKELMTHHEHVHDKLASHSFMIEQPLDPANFEHWMSMLITFSGSQLYRIKGVLNIKDEAHKMIFQSVRNTNKINVGEKWRDDEQRQTRIVFIGYNIDRKPLEKGLNSCISK